MFACVLIALATMIVSALAHHLGFVEKAYKEASQITACIRCTVFWSTLFVLTITDKCHLFIAIGLSFIVSYLAVWFDLLLGYLAKFYDRIWQKQSNKQEQTTRPKNRSRSVNK